MVKNHKLAKSISDAAWDQFAQWLEDFGKIYSKTVIADGVTTPLKPIANKGLTDLW